MTDDEWLQVLEKKFQVLKVFTSPVRAYGRGKGRMHICYCESFIIGRKLTIFPVWLSFCMQLTALYSNFANPRLKCAKWRDIR